jgi:hypothetical protein
VVGSALQKQGVGEPLIRIKVIVQIARVIRPQTHKVEKHLELIDIATRCDILHPAELL